MDREQVDRILSYEKVLTLFQALVAPNYHDHTTVPLWITKNRPKRNWPFMTQAIQEMFHNWRLQSESRPAKKRKKADQETAMQESDEEAKNAKQADVLFSLFRPSGERQSKR